MARFFYLILLSGALFSLLVGASAFYVFYTYGRDLPEYRQLVDFELPVMTRIHVGDGQLLAEYASEKRVFVPISSVPPMIIKAFLAAEDKNFFSHRGVDPIGVIRAILTNIKYAGKNRRKVGASTITQQVTKNFLLTNERSWTRKIKEAILAIRIERALTKERILELYLNKIYLGFGSYGIAAAALNYFNKSLNELSLSEIAFLAALPKAPNNYHPITKKLAAIGRRNWVISRMQSEGFIDSKQAKIASMEKIKVFRKADTEFVTAPYFAEEVRKELVERYGSTELYKNGLSVRTTLNLRLQAIADRVLRHGLRVYDRRHGWRGPLTQILDPKKNDSDYLIIESLKNIERPKGMLNWLLAVVLKTDKSYAHIALKNGRYGKIPKKELIWARLAKSDKILGPKIEFPSDVLRRGDVIAVEEIDSDAGNLFGLRQIPEINGALVALDPHTGRVLAMSGGYSQERSEFNRATQAYRQPGSAFKPFVYLTAIDSGKTPSTLILDAPFVIDQGPGLPKWRPANYTKKFYGPSTMRLGIEKSKNLMTVRLAQNIGMSRIAENATKFGIVDKLPLTLAASLGSSETTLLRITNAYAMLVNGGKKIVPTFIDRIQNRHGVTVFRHDKRVCEGCLSATWRNNLVPHVADTREQISDPVTAYQIVCMLEGVVERGTGRRIKTVGKPLAGKTGTTNMERDTWFIGFSPDLAVGVFIGFDLPKPLGKRETGSSVAAPVFRDFMKFALKNKPAIPFRIPPGVKMVRVNARTGKLAKPGEKDIILEAFKPGTQPTGESEILEGESWSPSGSGVIAPKSGTGSLY